LSEVLISLDFDSANCASGDARISCERDIGGHAYRDDGQFTFELGAILELDANEFAVLAEEFRQTIANDNIGSLAPDMIFHELGHVPVEEGENLREHFDDGDFDTRRWRASRFVPIIPPPQRRLLIFLIADGAAKVCVS